VSKLTRLLSSTVQRAYEATKPGRRETDRQTDSDYAYKLEMLRAVKKK